MLICMLINLEKYRVLYRVLWTDFLSSCREINWFSVSKICLEPAKPTISLALILTVVRPDSCTHTCDISRFRRELPIWSLSSRSHSRETKPPDERFFQCHFSRTVFLSEHFIVYSSMYLANKLFTAQKCLTFIDLIDDH